MNITSRLFNFFKASTALVATVTSILFIADDDDDSDDHPMSNGSDLFGEYNFRTGKMDAGADSDGWYEEDL
jgi:hypothetical protein